MKRIRAFQAAGTRFARIASPALSVLENMVFGRAVKSVDVAPVFIVGSPRSGSTALYQAITESTECVYVDNLAFCFHRNIRFGVLLSRLIFQDSGHGSFDSSYGNTHTLHSPSECGALWKNHLGTLRQHSHEASSRSSLELLSRHIYQVMNRYGRSFVFKYLDIGAFIPDIVNAFPNAKFIRLKRDPQKTIISLYYARQQAKVPENKWWSVRPRGFESLSNEPLISRLVGQVYLIEHQISGSLASLEESSVLTIDYSEMTDRMADVLRFVGGRSGGSTGLVKDRFQSSLYVDDSLVDEIRISMEKYDWSKVGY